MLKDKTKEELKLMIEESNSHKNLKTTQKRDKIKKGYDTFGTCSDSKGNETLVLIMSTKHIDLN